MGQGRAGWDRAGQDDYGKNTVLLSTLLVGVHVDVDVFQFPTKQSRGVVLFFVLYMSVLTLMLMVAGGRRIQHASLLDVGSIESLVSREMVQQCR